MLKKMFLLSILSAFSCLPVLAQVEEAWVARYNGPWNEIDRATAIAVDADGNVYVTGSEEEACANTCYFTDYATIKYSSSGDTLWVRRYNGPLQHVGELTLSSQDVPTALAVDAGGNVYVTGESGGDETSVDYATIKYNSFGDTLWVRRYDGPVNSDDYASALAVDNNGNVYVTGVSYGGGTGPDYATIKYSPNGDTLWVRRYDGPGNDYDNARALAVDNNGNVYVTGMSYSFGTGSDYATIKYAPNGDTGWVRRYNGPGNFLDQASALAVDNNGNVYVTGLSWGQFSLFAYATIKYSPNGDTGWVRRYNGPVNGDDYASALAVDNSGNVYVTGNSWGGSSDDYTTIKYSTAGDTLWVRRYNGPGNGQDIANALAIDGSGNVYVTGESYGSFADYTTIKYSSAGDTLWVKRYDNGANDEVASALAIDGNGNVYVTGRGDTEYQEGCDCYPGDYVTIKYVQCCVGDRGDVNSDGADADVLDLTYMVDRIFRGGPPASCPEEADVNSDGTSSNILDLTFLVDEIFRGGPPPGACI